MSKKKSEVVSRETGEVMESDGRYRFREEYLDPKGRELPDPVPMAPPVGYVKQESMIERMRAMIRSEHLRIAALQAGAETFDEADDFEVGDDYDPNSPYEEVFDPVDAEARMRLRQQDYAASVEARLGELTPKPPEEFGNGNGRSEGNNGKPSEGRVDDRGGSSGKRSEKRKDDPVSDEASGD